MDQVLIVADDLTGANANCALMKKIGLRAVSFLGGSLDELPEGIDVIAITTDSRSMLENQAYKEVNNKMKLFKNKPISLYSKRIDSTLRGNIGVELQAYQEYFDFKKTAICVPAFPDSGRLVINGRMYVNGNLLMNTDAAKDTKMSINSNEVIDNIKRGYKGKIKLIDIEEIEKGEAHLVDLIKKESQSNDLLVFDSMVNDHIVRIARAVIESEIDMIAVDPGPFTKELTSLLYKNSSISTKAIAVVGSVTSTTVRQLHRLKEKYKYHQVNVDPVKLIRMETLFDEMERCISDGLANIDDVELLIITTTPERVEDRLDLNKLSLERKISIDDISVIISRGLANISKTILEKSSSISGVFSSGGDITVALAEELLSLGIEIKDEVMPLAAYGRLIGGLTPNLKIVSKGGMVGDDTAMIECIEKILKLED